MSLNTQHQIKSTGRRQAGLPTGKAGFSLIELPVVRKGFSLIELPVVRKGFSLIELLVIIAIIALLIGILSPSISRVQISARKQISRSRMGWIEAGCEEFRHHFGYYPPSGPESIAQAMTGYQNEADDGKDGLGFKTVTDGIGRVYGPYGPTVDIPLGGDGNSKYFLDAFENKIYYYRYNSGTGAYEETDGDGNSITGGPAYITKIPQYRKNIALMSKGEKSSDEAWSTLDSDGNPSTGFSDVTNFLPE